MSFPRPVGRRWTPMAAVTALAVAVLVLLAKGIESVTTHVEPAPAPVVVATPGSVRVLEDGDYARRLEELLVGARSSIRVVMFSAVISDRSSARNPVRRVLDLLIARHRAGITVQVVLDHGVPPSRRQPGEDLPSENAFQELRAAGVPVRWDEDERTTHVKCVVIDDRWCLVGSHNWTSSALTRNREWTLEVEDPALAKDLTARMERVWAKGHP